MRRVLLTALIGAIGDQFGAGLNTRRPGYYYDLYYDPQRKEFWGLSDRGPEGSNPGDPFTGRTDGYCLVRGVLHSYRTGAGDLAGYVAPYNPSCHLIASIANGPFAGQR